MPTLTHHAPFTAETPLFEVLRDPRGHEVVSRHLPGLVGSAILHTLHSYPVGLVVETEAGLADDPHTQRIILSDIASIDRSLPAPQPAPERLVTPSEDYERAEVRVGSARAQWTESVPVYGRFELRLDGPSHGNPFRDVELRAQIDGPDGSVSVPGFYDGAGVFRLRYMPAGEGTFSFLTSSNARSLDGVAGSFEATAPAPGAHGPVRVAETFHFAHADGTRYRPIGTTSYAWIHQGDELEQQTLASLEAGPFNKMRMCVFPKSYLFNENEPPLYPFEGSPDAGFDFQRPSTAFWAHLERRVEQLGALGIEADLILFHAYDRWGFSTMDPVADDRYVRYAVARLASFANVWWSLANEYDLLFAKTTDDWERFARIVQGDDPVGHLLSIHNCRDFYDYSRPWVTHASIQRRDIYKTSEMTTEWRERWAKPVVIDECAYEGDIDQGWGNITGEEMTRRFWEGAVRGGYVGHGETYVHPDDILWWAKGGALRGSSPERIRFLRRILEEGPDLLEPSPLDWDIPRAGVDGEYYLYYFGFNQPTYRRFLLDPAFAYTVDVIDTWQMTVTRLDGTYAGRFTIPLPGRQYIAVRLQVAS
ncbi:uncharacterized protein DUF4038 [Diaminobutyricimonas aerilata]|uniref:Uncharacterized protein DUF4038 n=1 Tax=Diaminobutyricimonas aerilata TaxID=1162967 RepID=A0A2M9CFF7_9MICO|nr:DUF5605 domain-containing protein [Diaminobutyricimonas aerilata]PJJ70643.1 uncharacterized protein DUF4038 [Diaminobutyricimonas aerilata]